jgi:CelD/BcsL family acetyltransferase involved in cellulose biosynthesis
VHETRWSKSGQAGVLADEEVRKFHRRITPVLQEKGVLRLYGLRFDDQIIASLYALFENEIAYCYLQGFDPEFADFSPGSQILWAVIEAAVREHKRSIDFLRGREAYKYAWGARDVPTYRIRAHKGLSFRDTSDRRIAA